MNRRSVNSKVDEGIRADLESPWIQVLSDVRTEIQKTQQRLGELKQSEHIILGKISAGEPLPGSKTAPDA